MCHNVVLFYNRYKMFVSWAKSLQIAMTVFDVMVFVTQILFYVYISKTNIHTTSVTDQKAMNALFFLGESCNYYFLTHRVILRLPFWVCRYNVTEHFKTSYMYRLICSQLDKKTLNS